MTKDMRWCNILLLTAIFCVSLTGAEREPTKFESKTGKKVVCYYPNWAPYQKGEGHFEPKLIPDLCTHYIYAYAKINSFYDILPGDLTQDVSAGGYDQFKTLKSRIPNISTMVSIGGMIDKRIWFEMFNKPELREKFIKNVIYFLRANVFDGIDLDLQFIHRSEKFGNLYDPHNYALLIQEMRQAFDKESVDSNHDRLLLSIVVPSYGTYKYDLKNINDYVDWISVVGYNYGAPYETYHVSPLWENNDWNVNASIYNHLQEGASPNKILMGLPLYANSYTLLKEDENGLRYRATGKGEPGPYLNMAGVLSMKEVCQNVKDGWTVERPEVEVLGKKIPMGFIAYKGNQWMSYDDEISIKLKADYIKDQHLAGVMFWALNLDDFDGKCNGKSYPLVKTMVEALSTEN